MKPSILFDANLFSRDHNANLCEIRPVLQEMQYSSENGSQILLCSNISLAIARHYSQRLYEIGYRFVTDIISIENGKQKPLDKEIMDNICHQYNMTPKTIIYMNTVSGAARLSEYALNSGMTITLVMEDKNHHSLFENAADELRDDYNRLLKKFENK